MTGILAEVNASRPCATDHLDEMARYDRREEAKARRAEGTETFEDAEERLQSGQ